VAFNTRIQALNNLNEHNDQALERLAQIQSGRLIEANDIGQLFESITGMGYSLSKLLLEQSPHYHGLPAKQYHQSLADRMKGIKDQALNKSAGMLQRSRALSPHVLFKLVSATSNKLAVLDSRLEGSFSADDVTLDDLTTPHDLIRYMHQVGTELFFDPDSSKWSFEGADNYRQRENDKMKLHLVSCTDTSADEYFKSNPFLHCLDQIVSKKKFNDKRAVDDQFYILVDDVRVSIQMPLGCHFASIKIKKEREEYNVHFKFTNTTIYSTSKFRADLTEGILKNLRYEVSRSGGQSHVFDVTKTYANTEEAVQQFEWLVRLAVALKDVDTLEPKEVDPRLQDTIQAFMAGVINLRAYLQNYSSGTYEAYAKRKGTFVGKVEVPETKEEAPPRIEAPAVEQDIPILKKETTINHVKGLEFIKNMPDPIFIKGKYYFPDYKGMGMNSHSGKPENNEDDFYQKSPYTIHPYPMEEGEFDALLEKVKKISTKKE